MSDPTELLLDTLVKDIPSDIQGKLNGANKSDNLRSVSLQFLTDFLSEDFDPDVLLASDIRPSQNSEEAGKSLIERIAELDSEKREVEDDIKSVTYENLDKVLKGSEVYKESYDGFTKELPDWCHQMLVDNKGAQEQVDSSINDSIIKEEESDLASWESIIKKMKRNKKKNDTSRTLQDDQESPSLSSSSSIILYNLGEIDDILRLPTYARACVKSGNYGECVEIASQVRRLAIRYSEMPLIQSVEEELQVEIQEMINGLVRLLNTGLKQSHIVKIITYLRRIAPFKKVGGGTILSNEGETMDQVLQRVLLKSRYQYIMGEIEVLEPLLRSNSRELYLKRCLEAIREHCFQTVMIFESIFGNDKESQGNLLLFSFIKKLALDLCDIFNKQLPLLSDDTSRNGLLLQLIYCCQSLGRMGGNFFPIIMHQLQDIVNREKWCSIICKQKKLVQSMNKSIKEAGK